jgi:hypothetical protein
MARDWGYPTHSLHAWVRVVDLVPPFRHSETGPVPHSIPLLGSSRAWSHTPLSAVGNRCPSAKTPSHIYTPWIHGHRNAREFRSFDIRAEYGMQGCDWMKLGFLSVIPRPRLNSKTTMHHQFCLHFQKPRQVGFHIDPCKTARIGINPSARRS